jgi:hypothetical protein
MIYFSLYVVLTLYLCRKPNQVVTLYAGDNNEVFTVHKEFACHYSPVLKAAFNSNFIEGHTQTYRLQETTKRAVRLLVHWFYTQKLDTFIPKPKEERPDDNAGLKKSQDMALLELWILAEKLLIPTLQNVVAREIEEHRHCSHDVSTACLRYVYENTERGNLLRLLMVDICFCYLNVPSYMKHPERYPQEMLIELVTAFGNAIASSDRSKRSPRKDFSRYEVAEESAED